MGEIVQAKDGRHAIYSIIVPPGSEYPGTRGLICTGAIATCIAEDFWDVTSTYGEGDPYPPPADLDPIIRETYTLRPAPPMWLAILAAIVAGCVLGWVML